MLTPYSPLLTHDHAANDIALPLVTALSQYIDLHVYAPDQRNGTLQTWRVDGVTYHAGSPIPQLRRSDRIQRYPYAARASWSRTATKEAIAVAKRICPDILHAEYEQTADPLLRADRSVPTSITLHDLPGEVAVRRSKDVSTLRHWLQLLEQAKTARLKNLIVGQIDALFVRSERDKGKVPGATGIVEIAPVGLNPPAIGWIGDQPHTAVFGGAMWRLENETTALYLAREVMPIVREQIPDAELRIFGSRPSATVRALATDPGVTVIGEVEDYDDEFRHAGVTLAPAMVDAGLLMKAIRSMAMGCPVVLNSASAYPIVGLMNREHALVADGAAELAAHVVELMRDQAQARKLGEAARELVRTHFSWERTVDVYLRTWEKLS
jgi:hypothetical protein